VRSSEYRNESVLSFLRQLTTWHCPHSPAARRRMRDTDRRTDGHPKCLTDPASCTLRAAPIKCKKGKGSPYSITERRVPEPIPVLGSQPAGDVSHKPGRRLPLLFARPAVTPATLKRAATYQFCCLVNRGTMGVNSLPKTVTRQHRDCDLNPGPSAP